MQKVLKIIDKIAETVAKHRVVAVAITASIAAVVGWIVDPVLLMILAEAIASLI